VTSGDNLLRQSKTEKFSLQIFFKKKKHVVKDRDTQLQHHIMAIPQSLPLIINIMKLTMERDGVAIGLTIGVRGSIPGGGWEFLLLHRVQTDSGDHPASYPMGTRGSFTEGKAAEA
jgi:hypothetical protein